VGNPYGPRGWGILLALPGEYLWPWVGKHYGPTLGNPFGPEWGIVLALDKESMSQGEGGGGRSGQVFLRTRISNPEPHNKGVL